MKMKLLTLILAGAVALPASLHATSFLTAEAKPLLPDQLATVQHCQGFAYDTDGSGGVTDADMRYRLFVPVGYDPAVSYPVVVWLHGLSSEGTNNSAQLSGDQETTMHLVNGENRVKYPCFLLAPQRQSPTGSWYSATNKANVFGMLTDVAAQYNIDARRLYLVGVSYGSFGTFAFLTNQAPADPWHWAAGVPIAGNGSHGGASGKTASLAGFPLWIFHGAGDATVDIWNGTGSDDMAFRIRQNGGAPMYTRYNNGGHSYGMWNSVFSTPQLLSWMMAQRLEDDAGGNLERPAQDPAVFLTGYRVGETLSLEGGVHEEEGTVSSVEWWNLRIGRRTGTVTINAASNNLTIATGNFTAADIGSRFFLNHGDFQSWSGYTITAVTSDTQITISPGLKSSGMSYPYSNIGYEICPPGHFRAPVAASGTGSWSAVGIPLSGGSNTIGVTAVAGVFAPAQTGNSYLGGETVEIAFTTPTTDTQAPELAVTIPGPGPLLSTEQATITLAGTASDDQGVVSVTWADDHGNSGVASGTTTWNSGPIPLDPGFNIITVTARDGSPTNLAAKVLRVMRNAAPLAVTDAVSTPGETGVYISVLANDTDSDNQPLPLTITAVGAPTHGTAEIHGPRVRYLPEAGFRGTDSFTYTITDGATESIGLVEVEVTGTLVTAETVYFSQNFQSSNVVEDYVDVSAPDNGQFNDISNEVDGGSWTIDGGKLKLERAVSSGANNGAGMSRYTNLAGPPQFVRVAFEFSLTGVGGTGSTGTAFAVEVGNFTGLQDYNSNSNGGITNRLQLQGAGTGAMTYGLSPFLSASTPADGLLRQVQWYINSAAEAKSYVGPDGYLYAVQSGHSALWVDGVLIFDSIVKGTNYTNAALTDFRIRTGFANPIIFTLDNLTITEVALSVEDDPEQENALVSWRELHGLPADGSQDGAMPAGDGVANLVKYALNLAPAPGDLSQPAFTMAEEGAAGLPLLTVREDDGAVEFIFVRRRVETAPGVQYVIEQTGDWTGWGTFTGQTSSVDIDTEWQRVTCVLNPADVSPAFLQLRIEPEP